MLQICFGLAVGDVLELGKYSGLRVLAQLICQVDILLRLFVLTKSIVALFEYVFIGLYLKTKHTECHLPELFLLLNGDSQRSQTPPHECLPILLMLEGPQPPRCENARLILVMGGHDGHSMQSGIEVLTLNVAGPLCVRSGHFEVPRLRA